MLKASVIGNKITEARKKAAISQAQLAEQLFISPQAVGKWERGESMPDIITFNRMAEILSVDLNYFSDSFQSAPLEGIVDSETKETPQTSSGNTKKKATWDLSKQNLIDTDFSGLNNLHEKLNNTNIQRCLFVGSDMAGIQLKGNMVQGCDFFASDLSRSHFEGSHLSDNQFKNCLLKEARFSGTYLQGCDFSKADFAGATFKSAGFGKNTVTDAIWNGTSFLDTDLSDMVFEGTLEDCRFENNGFTRVKFQNATLINTFFKNNHRLKKIQFIDCKADKLTYAFLKSGQADMSGITLLEE